MSILTKVNLVFTEEMLGSSPANPVMYEEWLGKQVGADPDLVDEELLTLPPFDPEDEMAKRTTVFHRQDETPAVYNYVIKGFFKDSCKALRRCDDTLSKKIPAYRQVITDVIFAYPRLIPIDMDGGKITICGRPLRAQTQKGEITALARSEAVPAGSTMEFIIKLKAKSMMDPMIEWLSYGVDRGLGQWRNSGKGTFRFTLSEVTQEDIVKYNVEVV